MFFSELFKFFKASSLSLSLSLSENDYDAKVKDADLRCWVSCDLWKFSRRLKNFEDTR